MYKGLDREFLSRKLIQLGDMMGDGLHHGKDGKWISTEYRRISKLLYPEEFKRKREKKVKQINERIAELLENRKCDKCGGNLKQSRSGSKVINCTSCPARYKLGKAK